MLLGNTYTIPNIVNLPGQSGGPSFNPDAFVLKIKTDQPGGTTNNDQFELRPRLAAGDSNFDYTIDWGDGTIENINVAAAQTHTYASPGEYQIEITGLFAQLGYQNQGDAKKVMELVNWGNVGWQYMVYSFWGCTNMIVTAEDIENVQSAQSWFSTFDNCQSITNIPRLKDLITSNVTRMTSSFARCDNLGPSLDLTGWDLTNCQYFESVFLDCDGLTSIDVTGWRFPSTAFRTFANAFMRCRNLTTITGIEYTLSKY